MEGTISVLGQPWFKPAPTLWQQRRFRLYRHFTGGPQASRYPRPPGVYRADDAGSIRILAVPESSPTAQAPGFATVAPSCAQTTVAIRSPG